MARIALSHLPARYIHHPIDSSFYRPSDDRARESQTIDAAVLSAFDQVYMRTASSARHPVRNLHADIELQASGATSY